MDPQTDEQVAANKPAETLAATEEQAPVITDKTNLPAATEAVTESKGEAPVTTDATSSEPTSAPESSIAPPPAPQPTEAPAEAEKKTEEAPAAAPVEASAPAPTEAAPVAEPAAPTEQKDAAPTGPVWPEIPEDHPLAKMLKDLPDIIKAADGADEVYGITLNAENPTFHTKLIVQKFLRANANDLTKAREQLVNTLKWRKGMKPLELLNQAFDKKRFGGLGYVTEIEGVPGSPNKKDVVTFNIYGSVKDNKATFGDLEAFTKWRVAIMELGIAKLKLAEATEPIPDYGKGPDPYQGIQVHDYLSVSFLRQDPHVKVASKEMVKLFSSYYPETLSRKLFVNVPLIMGWMFTAMKAFLSKETVRKFTVLTYGNQLAAELGDGVPEVYGGKGIKLEEFADTTKWEAEVVAVATEA